eukprot:UN01975
MSIQNRTRDRMSKKVVKPPNSGYMLFMKEIRPSVTAEMKEKGENIKACNTARVIGQKWKSLGDVEKKEWNEKCAKLKQEYALYCASNDDEKSTSAKSSPVKDANKLRLPLSRVLALMKLDPDIKKVSKKAGIAVAKAMELFLVKHAQLALQCATRKGRKLINENDIAEACYCADEMDFYIMN